MLFNLFIKIDILNELWISNNYLNTNYKFKGKGKENSIFMLYKYKKNMLSDHD